MRVLVHWGIDEEPEQRGVITQGSLEEGMCLIKFSEGDLSWFTKYGDLWYEDEVGQVHPDPVNIQEDKEAT